MSRALDGRSTGANWVAARAYQLLLAATHPQGDFPLRHQPAQIDIREAARRSRRRQRRVPPPGLAQMREAKLTPSTHRLHGVYRVPSGAAQIREFAQRKPNQAAWNGEYNAMPGWAHVQHLRRIMQAYTEGRRATRLTRRGRVRLRQCDCAKRRAFSDGRPQRRSTSSNPRQDIHYVAHEYLTPHGDPFYFSEVEGAMRSAGLSYAGSMVPADNYAELMVPGPFRALMPQAPSRVALELHRDFIANTSFRPDLYIAQAPARQPTDLPLDRLDALAFCLVNLPERLSLRSEGGPLQFNLEDQDAAVRAVHELLAGGPASAREIHQVAGKRTATETSFLIQQLVVSRHLAPCRRCVRYCLVPVNSAGIEAGRREQWQQVRLRVPDGSGFVQRNRACGGDEAAAGRRRCRGNRRARAASPKGIR